MDRRWGHSRSEARTWKYEEWVSQRKISYKSLMNRTVWWVPELTGNWVLKRGEIWESSRRWQEERWVGIWWKGLDHQHRSKVSSWETVFFGLGTTHQLRTQNPHGSRNQYFPFDGIVTCYTTQKQFKEGRRGQLNTCMAHSGPKLSYDCIKMKISQSSFERRVLEPASGDRIKPSSQEPH